MFGSEELPSSEEAYKLAEKMLETFQKLSELKEQLDSQNERLFYELFRLTGIRNEKENNIFKELSLPHLGTPVNVFKEGDCIGVDTDKGVEIIVCKNEIIIDYEAEGSIVP